MIRSLSILILLTASAASAQVKRVDGNAPLVPTPRFYTVVTCPDNWKSDPACVALLNSFASNPTLAELRKITKVYTYNQSNPDWQEKWGATPAPMIAVMDGDKILYKRSTSDAAAIAGDLGKGRIIERIRQMLPNCPGPNCPQPNQPNQPYQPFQPTPNPLTPVNPNQPSNPNTPYRPLIPDTPVEPPVDYKAEIDKLTVRIEELEDKLANLPVKEGPPGPPGKDGADGEPGENGKDGQHGKDAELDVDALAATVAGKLPPITFERLDKDGAVLDSVDVHLGKKAKFPPLTVHYVNQLGSVLDTEYVPVGGTLNLQIDVLNK